MRSTLYLKFIIAYMIFGFLCLFSVSVVSSEITMNQIEETTAEEMYSSASEAASDYLPSYFSGEKNLGEIYKFFQEMQSNLEANVWFVNREGQLITSLSLEGQPYAPAYIEDFNPAENGNRTYDIGNYHDYFDKDVLTIIMPVTSGFTTNGYLLLHKPISILENECLVQMQPSYITALIIYILSFGLLIVFQYFVFRPLRQITEAATQYASGNLDYEIPVKTEDEIGYLSASLNYMSTQLRDMEDYQKKFIANVSHDFRSPLTSIKGYLEAMSDGTIPAHMQEKYFKIILFETERLTNLTQDLLTLNQFDTKNLLLNKSAFDIHEIIKSTATTFEGTCKTKHISIELLFACKKLAVHADKSKIQQVLYNLLDNAIKFSPNDSVITIETTERNDKVYISVKDRGIGIPKKSLSKIWDRFYKSDLSRGKDKKGTGLGLAIVKEIIQVHNEIINVVSTEGVGTEFIFTLPKA